MKNQSWKNLVNLIVVAVLAISFTQCQTEVAGVDQDDLTNELTEFRSAALSPGVTLDVCECINTNYPLEALSQEEIDGLLLMVEEEKMARDVYLSLYEQWDIRVFSNIARAEQKHMDVMLCLLQKYDLTDPVGDNPNGVFENSTLQDLYNTLLEQGSQDLTEAMKVGATIEDVDIFDLMELSANVVDNEDILAAFNELTKGSRNHLRAFMRQLNRLEETYAPQFISQELFDEIINSPKERGGEMCFTQGSGDCPNGNGGNGNGGNGNGGICPNDGTGSGPGTGICPNDGTGSGPGTGICPNDGTGSGSGTGICPNDGTGSGPGTGICPNDGTGSGPGTGICPNDGTGTGNNGNGGGNGNDGGSGNGGGNGNGGNGNGGNGGNGNGGGNNGGGI